MNFFEITTFVALGSIIIAGIITILFHAMDIDRKWIIWVIAIPVCVISLGMNFAASPKGNNNDDDILTRNPANRCECGGYKNANDSYCDKCWLDKLGY